MVIAPFMKVWAVIGECLVFLPTYMLEESAVATKEEVVEATLEALTAIPNYTVAHVRAKILVRQREENCPETYSRLHSSVAHPFSPTTDNTTMNTTFSKQSRKKNVTPVSLILLKMAPKLAMPTHTSH